MVSRLKDAGIRYRFLGNGTNIIVSDDGINDALIRISKDEQAAFYKDERRRDR